MLKMLVLTNTSSQIGDFYVPESTKTIFKSCTEIQRAVCFDKH